MDAMIIVPDYRVRQRDYLLDIARALTEQLDLREVLRRILAASAAMLAGEVAVIALRDEEDDLQIPAAYGVESEQLVAFDDLLADLKSVGFVPERMNLRTQQLAKRLEIPLKQTVALPLKISDEPIGLILVFRTFNGMATDNDRQVLQSFADQAAIAVQNARLYATVTSEKQRLAAILEYSADGIMILNGERRIIQFNRALSQLTGWRSEEALGRLYTDIIRWDHPQPTVKSIDEMLSEDWVSDQTVYLEGDLERLDGLRISVGITYALLAREPDIPVSIIANVRDITHFRKAAEMKDTFISVISHELKTPVALIKGYAGTYRREDAPWTSEDYREALAVIEEEADRLKELIDNLLAASKLQAEGMRLQLDDLDLVTVVERSVERFRTQTDKHHLIMDFPPDFPLVRADEVRIRQVVDNLISNALKYSPNGGDIRVSGYFTKYEVEISVQDAGVGLRPEQLEKVFERFYRVDDSLSRVTQGTGLGLYLARGVVEAHGGRIWAESEVNRGARFCFTLPR